jgi:hypothetical protein
MDIAFVKSSEDLKNSWICPKDYDMCLPQSGTDNVFGWIIFGMLMLTYLTKDLMNGFLLVLKASALRSLLLFFSGSVIILISGMTIWTSALYNKATTKTNADLITNAVILLFVIDIDEQVFSIASSSFPKWMTQLSQQGEQFSILIEEHRWDSSSNAIVGWDTIVVIQNTTSGIIE